MTEQRDRPRVTFLGRRILAMVGLLSLTCVAVAIYASIRLGETNYWLGESLGKTRLLVEAVDTARTAQVHFKKQVQEWKDVLLRGFEPDLYEKHLNAFVEEEGNVRTKLEELKGQLATLEIPATLVDEFLMIHADLGRRYRDALESYDREELASAVGVDRAVRGIDREATDRMDAIVQDMKFQWETRVERYTHQSYAELEKQKHFSEGAVVIIGCCMLIGILFSIRIVRDLRRPP